MFDFLHSHDGPVVAGLEQFERVYAKNQPEYIPLRTLPGGSGMSAISRWHLTDEQRKAIAAGADILLESFHFGNPLSPVRMAISNNLDIGGYFPSWFCVQFNAPMHVPTPTSYPTDGENIQKADENAKASE